ncbi:hypothetical protein [Nannocystis sp.]|uniref:hypothetical protein n=1 Tax=Nannocystis sp. TaxID=1962667 RepID=UPI0025E17903|nr:hypothetical protein [Nannocystis sp.]MBK7824156.1 hypothetical protein [Nannocystis sp.]
MTYGRTLLRLAPLALLAAPLLAPSRAHASGELARASSYETPPRKGFYGELALRPGAVVVPNGLVPALRHHLTFGAGLTDRFKLGMSLQIGGYLETISKPVLGMDVLATGYLWRGLYLRGGFGMINRMPLAKHSSETRAGYGGTVGFGYEWTVKKAAGIGLGVDLDTRLISAHRVRHSFFVGLHFHFH